MYSGLDCATFLFQFCLQMSVFGMTPPSDFKLCVSTRNRISSLPFQLPRRKSLTQLYLTVCLLHLYSPSKTIKLGNRKDTLNIYLEAAVWETQKGNLLNSNDRENLKESVSEYITVYLDFDQMLICILMDQITMQEFCKGKAISGY